MSTRDNKELIVSLFGAWSRGDIRPLIDAMADDFRWVFPGSWSWSGTWQPKTVVVEQLLGRQLGGQLAEGYQSHPDFVLADGDRVVVQTRGRSMTKQGVAYNNTYCLIFSLRDGKLTEVIEHCDTSLVERVLSVPPIATVGWSKFD